MTDAPADPSLWLAKYLKLYFKALKKPCQVRSDWVSPLVLGESLEKKVIPSSYEVGYSDPYEEWVEGRDSPISADTLKQEWEEPWREAFAFFAAQEEANVQI